MIDSVKRFNNWVKSVLIHRFAPPNAVALDLCCGKVRRNRHNQFGGNEHLAVLLRAHSLTLVSPSVCVVSLHQGGDLLKFKKANVRTYVGADHALQSIKDGMQR